MMIRLWLKIIRTSFAPEGKYTDIYQSKMCLRYPGWLVIMIIRTLGDNPYHPDTHDMTLQQITSRAGQPSANHRPVCPPQKTNQVLTVPGPCFVMRLGPHDTWDMGHCFMIDHLDFVSFYGFPKPIKNTQSLHCVAGVSFLANEYLDVT